MPTPVFAVVDGGRFNDFAATLDGAQLRGRSLFMSDGQRDVERFGPWFVALQGDEEVYTLLNLVNGLPAVVFWCCTGGDVMLYGHLRRLNQARIPVWAASGKPGPSAEQEHDAKYEAVTFRHWDPNVLGALLPVMEAAQFSRIVGPADEVVFNTPDYGGIRRVVSDPSWPFPARGLLTVTAEQIDLITARRVSAQRRQVANYLREVTGDDLDSIDEVDLLRHVTHSEASARALGIQTEAGRCRWAYLLYATRGRIAQESEIVRCVTAAGKSPDERVSDLMDSALRSLRDARGHSKPGWPV